MRLSLGTSVAISFMLAHYYLSAGILNPLFSTHKGKLIMSSIMPPSFSTSTISTAVRPTPTSIAHTTATALNTSLSEHYSPAGVLSGTFSHDNAASALHNPASILRPLLVGLKTLKNPTNVIAFLGSFLKRIGVR